MRKFLRWATLCMAVALVTTACSDDDESEPLKADFKIAVTGSAPNAKLTITNTSTGASAYAWAFSPGAGTTLVSSEKNPAELTIERPGKFDVTLVATQGTQTSTLTQSVTVEGNRAIYTYTNIEFALKAGSTAYGRFFSTTTGKIYKDSEVTSANGADIDIAFGSFNGSLNFFLSPDDKEIKPVIPNATTTAFANDSETKVTVAAFDAAKDDSFIAGETIVNDGNGFGTTRPHIVTFQTKDGRKGAIVVRALNADRILVDIKVQK